MAVKRSTRPVADGHLIVRLQWAIAAAGGGAFVLAALAPLLPAYSQLTAPNELLHACRRLAGHPSATRLLMVAATTIAMLAVIRGGAALMATLRATCRTRALRGGAATLHGLPVTIVPTARVVAFTAGWLRPRVFVSEGAIGCLAPAQLAAVLAHEEHHRARRDPLRLALRRVLADALFFVPRVRDLRRRHDDLAEIAADSAAARSAGGDVRPLAGALLAFDGAAPAGAGISPARVDRLLSSMSLPLPRLSDLFASAVVAAALLALALVVAVGPGASEPALRPCAALLAATAVAAWVGWRVPRRG
ncbi:M48 family metalloprotease [Conexibacter arvalis]|uniref:Peptidase M48 domain-containing protein n=1 Tax=Conexibacter arvalis TaxID=912552 RepID=A0A840IK51_9ACTN|nr:M48 family metalloprotease [Conexibacter arvalis]MBB4664523.1 hypothetical protein [Conexibacter arvalis]